MKIANLPDPKLIKQSYNIVPGPKMGLVTPEILESIAKTAKKHHIPLIKITSAQRLAFVGHEPDDVPAIWQDLGLDTPPQKAIGVAYVQSCPGKWYCKYGRQNSISMGQEMEQQLTAIKTPAKVKIGVSGCPMNCCESYIRDLGVFGKKKGWTVIFGGNGGGNPRIGDIIDQNLSQQEAINLAWRCLDFYRENARNLERTARFMERTDLGHFKKAVGVSS